jgi:uncharacterized DUF497 family protein
VGCEEGRANRRKHGVSFDGAATVFLDQMAVSYPDPDHSLGERREVTIGYSNKQQVLFVAIASVPTGFVSSSARKATKGERKQYDEGITEENR